MSQCKLTIIGLSVTANSPESMQQAMQTLNSLVDAAFPQPEPPAPKPKRKRLPAIRPKMAKVKDVGEHQ